MAGTIDQLNFEVILTDDAFQKKVKDDIGLAEELNDKLTTALEIKKKVDTKTFDEIANSIKNIEKHTESLDKKHRNYNSGIKQTNTALSQTTDIMRTLTRLTGLTFGVETVRRFVGALVSVTGEFEVQKMALTSMLQDADKADEIFNTLRQEALNSPYTFQDLTKYAKQLTAFNIDADQLIETEKRLADVAAGLGVDMGRIILAYGQVKAAGVLKGTELRQFTEAGVPLLQSLAEQIQETEGHAISLSEVFQRITKKEIPFEMVEEAFKRMTSEGGKFYNMQEVLVNTLQGKIGKLRDVWQQALYDIGSSQDSFLKGAVDTATWLVSHMEKIGGLIMPIVKGFGAYAAILAVVALRQKALQLARFVTVIARVATGANSAAAAMRLLGSSAKATAGAIGTLVSIGLLLYEVLKNTAGASAKFSKELDEIHKNARDTNSYDAEIGRLKELRNILGNTNNSYEARRQALAEIKSIVPGYHAQLTEEGKLINNNKEALDGYIESMNREAKMAGAKDELTELYKKRREVSRNLAEVWKNSQGGAGFIGYGLFGQELSNDSQVRNQEQLHTLSLQLKEVDKRIADVNKEVSASGGFIIPNEDNDWGYPAGEPGADIQARIAALKEVQGYYETLKDVMSDADIQKFFDANKIQTNGFNFWEQILELTKELEQVNPEAAARIFSEYNKFIVSQKAADAKDAIKTAEEQAAALEKWRDALHKWQKDWGGDYKGIEYDIDRVVRDYNNEDEEITKDYLESLDMIMEAHWGDAEAIQKEVDALDKLVAARRAANSTAAQEKLNDLAAKYVKENTKDLNLRDWGDKSIGQIRGIYRTLTELAAGEIVVDETLQKRLDDAGVKIEDFAKLSKEEFKELADNAKEELMKRLGDTIREIISDLSGLASAMGEVAEMSGNKGVVAFADAITNMMPMVESTIDKLSKGDYIGAVVGWFSQVVTGFFRAKQEVMQLNAAIRAAQEDARRSGLSDMLTGGTESIFGANGMARVNNALSVLNKVRSTMGSRGVLDSFSVKRGFWDWFVGQGGMSKLRYMQFSISELAQSVGRDLYDAYGNLNAETLQAILDTYENLGQTEKEWITQAINDSEAYAEAMEQLESVVESVFGQIASSSSDAIVDQWKERSDAALDYADILDDVATRYAKMMIESEILDRVLTPDKASSIVDMFARGDAEGAMASIAEDMATIQGMAPLFEQILSAFDPYFNRAGAESASNSLREGINKELVEGNSSLIASYMNAMRADLSVVRGLQSIGWQDVRLIREYAPTYADYMARIEANTFDNAQAAQSILARLQSIITPSTNGGSAVRTTR